MGVQSAKDVGVAVVVAAWPAGHAKPRPLTQDAEEGEPLVRVLEPGGQGVHTEGDVAP